MEVKLSLEQVLAADVVDVKRLAQICLQFNIPAADRTQAWLTLLGGLPAIRSVASFHRTQQEQQFADLLAATLVISSDLDIVKPVASTGEAGLVLAAQGDAAGGAGAGDPQDRDTPAFILLSTLLNHPTAPSLAVSTASAAAPANDTDNGTLDSKDGGDGPLLQDTQEEGQEADQHQRQRRPAAFPSASDDIPEAACNTAEANTSPPPAAAAAAAADTAVAQAGSATMATMAMPHQTTPSPSAPPPPAILAARNDNSTVPPALPAAASAPATPTSTATPANPTPATPAAATTAATLLTADMLMVHVQGGAIDASVVNLFVQMHMLDSEVIAVRSSARMRLGRQSMNSDSVRQRNMETTAAEQHEQLVALCKSFHRHASTTLDWYWMFSSFARSLTTQGCDKHATFSKVASVLRSESRLLHTHVSKMSEAQQARIERCWFAECFATTLPPSCLERIWDRVIAGSIVVVCFVGLALTLTLAKEVLAKKKPAEVCDLLCNPPAQLVERQLKRILELSYTLWRKNGAPVLGVSKGNPRA